MKYTTTLALVLASTSQVVNAGNIGTEFSKDDTLTATRMNEIRTAVNSKQDRVGGICEIDEAISSINSDGTVGCRKITSSGSGGATTPDYYYISGLDLKALETTGQIHIPDPRTRDPSESSEGEQHNTQTRWNAYDIDGQYAFPTQEGAHEVGHTVRLPSGVTMVGVRCYYYDNDPNYDITAFDYELRKREYRDRKSGDRLLKKTASRTSGASSTIKELDGVFNHTIDNAKNTYYLLLHFGVSTGYSSTRSGRTDSGFQRADASDIRTYGCRIKYEPK